MVSFCCWEPYLVACSKVPDGILSGKEDASSTGGYAIGRSHD